MAHTEENCPECNAKVYWESERCPVCRHDMGAPNVRLAQKERGALQQRYATALEECRQRGIHDTFDAFTKAVEQKSQAVINVSPSFLQGFLAASSQFYSGYALQTAAETRAAADFVDDTARLATEGKLFGTIAPHLRYAALSLDGRGLESYGSCSLTLDQRLCARAASLLEENSFHFIEKHRLLPRTPIPPGYRSVWEDRHLLAAAKLAGDLDARNVASDFPALLLYCEGNRETDRFIEVYLYGPFDNQAIVAAMIPLADKSCKNRTERYALLIVGDLLTQRDIPWQPA